MLKAVILLLFISIVGAVLGYSGIVESPISTISKIVFFTSFVLFFLCLIGNRKVEDIES